MTARLIVIPADDAQQIHLATLETLQFPAVNNLLAEHHGGSCYLEEVRSSDIAALWTMCVGRAWQMEDGFVMLVDEEGRMKGLPGNQRATLLASHGHGQIIVGTALLAAVGMVPGEDGDPPEPDYVDLPERFDLMDVIRFLN